MGSILPCILGKLIETHHKIPTSCRPAPPAGLWQKCSLRTDLIPGPTAERRLPPRAVLPGGGPVQPPAEAVPRPARPLSAPRPAADQAHAGSEASILQATAAGLARCPLHRCPTFVDGFTELQQRTVQSRALICAVLNFTSCLWVRCRTITDGCSSVLTAISLPSCVFLWKEITDPPLCQDSCRLDFYTEEGLCLHMRYQLI